MPANLQEPRDRLLRDWASADWAEVGFVDFAGCPMGSEAIIHLVSSADQRQKKQRKMEIQEPITPPDISSSLIHYNNSFPSFHSLHASYSSSHLIKVLSSSPLHFLFHLLSYDS